MIKLGISSTLDSPGEAFSALNLHLYAGDERDPRNVWWQTPVRWLGEAGAVRLGGVSITWGPVDDLAALVAGQPDPTALVVPFPPAPQPTEGPLAAAHVVWLDTDDLTEPILIEVDCLPDRASVVRVFSFGEG